MAVWISYRTRAIHCTPQSARAYISVWVDMLTAGTGYDANQTVVEFITSGSGAKAVANLNTNMRWPVSQWSLPVQAIRSTQSSGLWAMARVLLPLHRLMALVRLRVLGPGNGHNITVLSGGSNMLLLQMSSPSSRGSDTPRALL